MRTKRILAGLGARLRVATRDAVGLSGCGLVAYGCWLLSPALGFIGGGLMLIALATLTVPKGQGDKQ